MTSFPVPTLLRLLAFAVALSIGGCASMRPQDHPAPSDWIGRIFDTRTGSFITREEVMRRALESRLVLLGEAHDNAEHHRLQAEILNAMIRGGRKPAVAMEQFDHRWQQALDTARAASPPDAERLAEAGKFDRKGWRWPDYKPLVELALEHDLPLVAANLSREEAREVVKSGQPVRGIVPADSMQKAELERDIIEGHCGVRPEARMLSGMVEAQRARDALMAQMLQKAGPEGAVLIAGAGHVRRNRGVPLYLAAEWRGPLLSLGFVEVGTDAVDPKAFAGVYDLVWFTSRAKRDDPCRDFRLSPAK